MRKLQVPEALIVLARLCVRFFPHHKSGFILGYVCFALTCVTFAADNLTPKNVLLLYSFSERNFFDSADSLEATVRERFPGPVNFYLVYLEAPRFEDAEYGKRLAKTLGSELPPEKIDLIITAAYPALHFVLQHRDDLFSGIPIVFTYLYPGRIAGQKIWPGVTGVTVTVDLKSTLGLALHLHPNTNTVAVITNNSEFERYWLAQVQSELHRFQDKVKEVDIVGLPPDEVLRKVSTLPPQTIVLFTIIPQDTIHPAIGPYDIVAKVGKRLPTYCIFPKLCLNHGGIGGADYGEQEQTTITAELANRVLSGEAPENIPIVHSPASKVRVDWRLLRRWQIPESALPAGTEMLYRKPTFWERKRKYIIAAAVVVLAQMLPIVALLWQRARKRKAEVVLRESEERFRVMADTTPFLIWMCDPQGRITYLNYRRMEFTGSNSIADYREASAAFVHPNDLKGLRDSLSAALKTRQSFSKEYRLRRHDGVYRWIFDVASPRVNGDDSFSGFIGSGIDITDQKLAQQALENVSGQLIDAQEKERARIARDLHDDICQRLALLSMELEQAKRNGSPPATKEHLEEIRQHCSEIASDVQSLSHQLHSSKLEYLGVVAAISGFCKEFARQHKIDAQFEDRHVPPNLPKDVSLCLFRVAQEALNNAVKYSGTRQIAVTLSGADNQVRLVISDAGAGFDVERAKRDRGLGLISMQERVHLVHGHFNIESQPGAGTKIVAVVPLVAANADDSVAGAGVYRTTTGAA